jgi:hypothetical protein
MRWALTWVLAGLAIIGTILTLERIAGDLEALTGAVQGMAGRCR